MVSTAVPSLTPWPLAGVTLSSGSTAEILRQTVCRLAPIPVDRPQWTDNLALAQALEQLVAIVMTLRSPEAGWPAEIPLTPETLAPYISEEVDNFLDVLDQAGVSATHPTLPLSLSLANDSSPRVTLPIPALIPHILWLLASSGYEVMHLVEGGKARVYSADHQVSIRVIRLVPVLLLTTDDGSYALDLVTQAEPSSSLCLANDTQLRLIDNDLDSRPRLAGSLLADILALIAHTQPQLHTLLTVGQRVMALRPFQSWQAGTLRLHLHLADMGWPDPTTPPPTIPPSSEEFSSAESSAFTLDDFANTLTDEAGAATAGVLGDWLTFTDDAWVQSFLHSYAQQLVMQGLPSLGLAGPPTEEATDPAMIQNGGQAPTMAAAVTPVSSPTASLLIDRELACTRLAHTATSFVHGPNGLFKHTFVHGPALVSDVWPRLRWYLAQSSERVMQLMGGLPAQVLCPGRGWQQGILSLRALMHLATPSQTWTVDLGSGRLLPVPPLALPTDAILETAETGAWANRQTIAELTALVEVDLKHHAPAIAALAQGTAVNLHRLETEEGCQPAALLLSWCFTWAYGNT